MKVAVETTKYGPLQRYERLRQRMTRSGGGGSAPALVAATMQMARGLVLYLTSSA
jgi:hypothetical protein